MDQHRSVRWGILGPGDIAAQFAAALAQSPVATCVAVGSRSAERAAEFAQQHSIPRAYSSYVDLVADNNIDVVYVATPQSLHHEHGRLALDHGRAVVIEKPMAMTYEQTRDLIDIARDRGQFLMEGLWTLCNPLVRRLVDLVHGGKAGRVQALMANCGPLGIRADHRALNADMGAGLYREVLVYPLALWSAVTSQAPVADINAAALTLNGVDLTTCVIVRTVDGRIASVGGSFAPGVVQGAASRAQLTLPSGWAEVDDVYNPSSLRIATTAGYTEHALEDNAGFGYEIEEVAVSLASRQVESTAIPHALSLHLAQMLDDVAQRIREERHT